MAEMVAKGFAVIGGSGIHINTVSQTEVVAMVNGLATIMRLPVTRGMGDEDIRDLWMQAALAFDVRVVPVTITYERGEP
jgi:hypothetical protein